VEAFCGSSELCGSGASASIEKLWEVEVFASESYRSQDEMKCLSVLIRVRLEHLYISPFLDLQTSFTTYFLSC
jgi:hypothetical protein